MITPHIIAAPLRGGSTLLRLMVDGHPRLSCPGETDFLFDFLFRTNGHWRYDRAELGRSRIFQASGLTLPGERDGLPALAAMIAQIARPNAQPVLMLHRNFERAAEIFPNARVVHLKRDPRDIARSTIGMGWAGNVYHGVTPWLETFESWEDASRVFRAQALDLQYESLVNAPRESLAQVAGHFGNGYDPAMLAYDTRSTYERPDPSRATQWRQRLTAAEVQVIEARLGDRISRYGYAPSGLPRRRIGHLGRVRLWLDNKSAKFGFRRRRYGLRNVLELALARRMGSRAWRWTVQARFDEIDRRHLR